MCVSFWSASACVSFRSIQLGYMYYIYLFHAFSFTRVITGLVLCGEPVLPSKYEGVAWRCTIGIARIVSLSLVVVTGDLSCSIG